MNLKIEALARKEFLQLLRDKRSLALILVVPLVQVILFGYVAATDVKNIRFTVADFDRSAAGREIVAKIEHSGFFNNAGPVSNYQELEKMLDAGQAKIGLVIPAGFQRDLASGATPSLQVLVDGTDSNTAAIAQNYFLGILADHAAKIRIARRAGLGAATPAEPLRCAERIYYNPQLRAVNFMVPGITAIVLLLITTMLTALTIVKEKENGTIEQLWVTPIKPWEFILGKLLPFPLIGLIDVILSVFAGSLWFGIPIKGSICLLFLGALLFLMTTLGMGLLISGVSSTQQQAMLTTIFFLIPNILLSGFIFPIANMPVILRGLTYLIPTRYFIEIIRAIYLKGLGLAGIRLQLFALLGYGAAILGYAILNTKKRL